MNARVIKVIVTDLELRGKGTSESVYRRVTQYWTLDGELLAEVDPAPDKPASNAASGLDYAIAKAGRA